MKLLFSIFFTLFFSTQVFADDNIVNVETISKDKKIISILYPDNYAWTYERFLIQTGKLQESIGRKIFASKEQALSFIKPNKSIMSTGTVIIKEVTTEDSSEKIWQDTNKWSSSWERKYSQWFRENVTKDFFVKYNIATDCADAAIAFRWIFSRIYKLPAGQTLAGTKTLFTNRSFKSKWKNYRRSSVWHKDKVFMASLKYLVRNTYTHSLKLDSYPVAITPEHLSEGAYRLTIGGNSGHTVLVHRQNYNGIPLSSLNSTVPIKVRSLSEAIFIPDRIEKRKAGGLVKHLWIVPSGGKLVKVRAKHMPGYSLEQYDPEFGKDNFGIAVLKRIDPDFNAAKVYKNVLKSTVDVIKQRISVVKEGYEFCSANDCSPGTQNYEDWSTPSRDKQLKEQMSQEENLFYAFSSISEEVRTIRANKIKEKNIEILGELYSYEFIKSIWPKKYFNSDPRASLEQRWALSAKDFRASILDKIKEYDESLMLKISQSNCISEDSCPKFSRQWNKEQTIYERGVIKTYLSNLISYCEWRDIPCVDYFTENLKDLRISNYNYYDYTKFIFTGSFDPHSSAEDKAGNRSELDSTLFIKPNYVGQTKSYLVSEDFFGFSYVSMATKERTSLPIDGSILASAKDSNSIVYKSKSNEIFYLDIDSGKPVLIRELKAEEVLKRIYMHNNKVFLATDKSFEYIDPSSGSAEFIITDDLNENGVAGHGKLASSKLDGDKFYLVLGRILFIADLATEEVSRAVIPTQVKDDYFEIDNISDKYIFLDNKSSEAKVRTLIFDKTTSELLKVMVREKTIEWFYGSNIFRTPPEEGSGFELYKINDSYEPDLSKKCDSCSGYVTNSNLRYTEDNIEKLFYWDGAVVVPYSLTYKGVQDTYRDYVIEIDQSKNYYVMSKTDGEIAKVKHKGYKYSRMTDLGLTFEYHASFNDDELPMSYDVDYIFSKNGKYIPLDYAVSRSYPDGTSDEVIRRYNFIEYNEIYAKYDSESPNIVDSQIEQQAHYAHTGAFFNTGHFTLWINVK